jgi:hypothetical protein
MYLPLVGSEDAGLAVVVFVYSGAEVVALPYGGLAVDVELPEGKHLLPGTFNGCPASSLSQSTGLASFKSENDTCSFSAIP